VNETQVPSTPTRRSHPPQWDGNLDHSNEPRSPDGGVSIYPPNVPGTLPSPNPSLTPQSSPRANIGIRRAPLNSLLSGSPARPGHATCMRQIFEDASTHQRDKIVSYPQLPIPPSTTVVLQPLRRSSTSSSESWSGDSEFLVPAPTRAPSPPISQEIDEWLDSLSLEDSFSFGKSIELEASDDLEPVSEAHVVAQPSESIKRTIAETTSSESLSHSQTHPCIRTTAGTSDPFQPFDDRQSSFITPSKRFYELPIPFKDITNQRLSSQRDIPQERHELKDGGVELHPLSPNVCTKRGVSHGYHFDHASSPHTPVPSLKNAGRFSGRRRPS